MDYLDSFEHFLLLYTLYFDKIGFTTIEILYRQYRGFYGLSIRALYRKGATCRVSKYFIDF